MCRKAARAHESATATTIEAVLRLVPALAAPGMLVLGLISGTAGAQVPVGIPSTFWGTVAVDGGVVPAGTEVRGFIEGRDCTQLGDNYRTVSVDGGVSSYAIEVVHESQTPGCGAVGKTVTFTVGGRPAAQAVPWAFGPTRIDLTIGEGRALPLPTATPAGRVAPPLLTATASAEAVFTPRAGTPPVDNVDPREILGGAGGTPTAAPPASGQERGGSAFVPLALAVAGLAAVGGLVGWRVARRSAKPPG